MQTHKLQISDPSPDIRAIRWELFVFDEILDVRSSQEPDEIVVVFEGRPRPGEWIGWLRHAGYDTVALAA